MDIGLFIVDNCVQLVVEDGDLKADTTLETAVIISLFTDQRVREDELPDGIETRKGWWGDMFPSVEGDQIGSKIWTLDRAKVTLETLAGIENFSLEALQWMIDDGVAQLIEVIAEYDEFNRAIAAITITRPTGEQEKFAIVWDEQEILRG